MPSYINNPATGVPTPLDTVDAVYGLALMYGRLLVGGANIQSRYDFFDKDFMQYGAIVADAKVKAVESQPVNPQNTNFGAPKYAEVLPLYFAEWNDRSYEVEIKDSETYAVVDGSTSFEVFVAQIINSLNEGERMEKNANYERLLLNPDLSDPATESEIALIAFDKIAIREEPAGSITGGVYGVLKTLGQYEIFDNPTNEQVFTEIRNVVKGMTFENDTYSGGYFSGARLEDLAIIAPYEWLNETGVTFLSRLFNLSEADLLARIIEAPNLQNTFTKEGGSVKVSTIFILHRNAIGRVVRYRSSMTDFVRQRWARWFGNVVVDMYYFNKYEKAYALVINEYTAKN